MAGVETQRLLIVVLVNAGLGGGHLMKSFPKNLRMMLSQLLLLIILTLTRSQGDSFCQTYDDCISCANNQTCGWCSFLGQW